MPDLQGTASFIGEFLKGYMGQTAQLEDQKLRKVSGILDVADRYRRMAEDPYATDDTYNHAQKMYQQQVSEADKIMNQKSSTIGSIMKIFGFGKKGANGEPPAIPRYLFNAPTMSGGEAQVVPESTPVQSQDGATGAGAEIRMNPAGLTPLWMRRPQLNYSGPGGMQIPAPAPGDEQSPQQPPEQKRYVGLGPIARQQQMVKDIEAERENKYAIERARQVGAMQQQLSREDYTWKQGQSEEEGKRKLEIYRNSPQWEIDTPQVRSAKMGWLSQGIPFRPPTPRIKTEKARDENNRIVMRTIDYSTGEILSETPYIATSDEPKVQALIAEGVADTPEAAQAEIGRRELKSGELTAKTKEGNIAAQAENSRIRAEREKYLKAKNESGGALTGATAKSLYRDAMAYGVRMLAMDAGSVAMSKEEKDKFIEAAARKYVEGVPGQEGLMKWEDLRKIAGSAPAKTAQEEYNEYVPKKAGQAAPATPAGPAKIYNFKK